MAAFDLPASPGFNGAKLRLLKNREMISSPFNKIPQTALYDGDLWIASFSLPPVTERERETAEAWASALIRGIEESFYLSPPFTETLLSGGDPGTPLVDGGSQTGRTLDTDGWTSGYALKIGDWYSFSNGTFDELHKLKSAVTADGSGDAALVSVRSIMRSPSNDAPLRVSWPRGEFRLQEPEAGIDVDDSRFYHQQFTAVEYIQ